MSSLTARNTGGCRFSVTHTLSEACLVSDPPAGHGGEGASFSPVDLCVSALLTCTGTMIAVKAASLGIDVTGMALSADYAMADAPRRIAACDLRVEIPCPADARQKRSLMLAAAACPVRNSLRPDTAVSVTFAWADGSTDLKAE